MPRKPPPAEEGPSKAWLDSYADAMTLLLAFFILLFAFSLVDEEKFTQFKFGVYQANGKPFPAVEGGIGILDQGNGVAELVAAPPAIPEEDEGVESDRLEGVRLITETTAEELLEELQERVAALGAAEFVSLEGDPRGVVIRMDSRVLFRSGSSLILPDGQLVLDVTADILAPLDNLIVVEGHTDSVPPNGTTFPTNWELSTSRATTVLRYMSEIRQIPGARMSATGYAATRPRAFNDTAEGRALNRRVELVVIIEEAFAAEGGDAQFGDAIDENPVGLTTAINTATTG